MAKEQIKEAPEDNDAETQDDEPEQKASVTEEDGQTKVRLPEDGETRKERRRQGNQRYDKLQEEARMAREEAAQERRRAQEASDKLLRAYQEQNNRTQSGSQTDPYKAELVNIRREQELISSSMRAGTITSTEEADRLRERYYELEQRKDDIKEERLERRITARIPQQQQGTGEEAILRAEFADVSAHPGAVSWARARYDQLRAEGKPGNLDTARQAMREAREHPHFGFTRAAPAASAVQQARYGAISNQAGTRGGSNGEVVLTKEQKRMALAKYPRLAEEDENKAYIQWAADWRKWEKENPV